MISLANWLTQAVRWSMRKVIEVASSIWIDMSWLTKLSAIYGRLVVKFSFILWENKLTCETSNINNIKWTLPTKSCKNFFHILPDAIPFTGTGLLVVSSSWWRTPSRALSYWRPDAKYLSPLPSSMPCEPRNSVTVSPPQSFSAKWFLDDRRVSSSQMVDVVRQRWHDGGLPRDSTAPCAQRTSTGRTWPFQRLASSL